MNILKRISSLIPKRAGREERTFYTELAKAIDSASNTINNNTSNAVVFDALRKTGIPVSNTGALGVKAPNAPTGFTASAAFTSVVLGWDSPAYNGHSYVEIYRHTADDQAQAVANGVYMRSYANVAGDTVESGTTHYYWIRFVNAVGQSGPFNAANGTEATTAVAYVQMLSSMKGLVDVQHLATSLATPIGKIDTIESGLSAAVSDIGIAQTGITSLQGDMATAQTDILALPPLINAAQAKADTNAQSLLESNALYSQEIADARGIAENNASDLVDSVINLSQAYSEEAAARRQSVGEVQQYINAIITTDPATGEITLNAIASFQSKYDQKLSVVDQRLSAAEGKFALKVWQTDVDAKGNEVLSAVNDEILARSGVCSISNYADAGNCVLNGGTWTLSSLAQEKKTLIAQINTAETTAKAYADTQVQVVADNLTAEASRIDTLNTSMVNAQSSISAVEQSVTNIDGQNYTLQINNATSRITQNETDIATAKSDIANVVITTYTKAETDTVVAESATAVTTALQGNIAAVENNTYTKSEVDQTIAGTNEVLTSSFIEQQADSSAAADAIIKNALTAASEAQARRQSDASITKTNEVMTEADNALASEIVIIQASVGSNEAAIISEATARATADSAQATLIESLQVSVGENNAAIQSEQTVRATADTALASDITALQTSVGDNQAAILSEQTARATADTAQARVADTIKATLEADGNVDAYGNPTYKTVRGVATNEIDVQLTSNGSIITAIDALGAELVTKDVNGNITGLSTALEGEIKNIEVSPGNALASTVSSLESAVNDATTGLATKASTTELNTAASSATSAATDYTKQQLASVGVYDSVTGTTSTVSSIADESVSNVVTTDINGNITNLSASAVKAVQIDNGNGGLATVEQNFTAERARTDGLEVKYGVKLDVNGYVTGFEQNNNGTTGMFAIRADTFALIDPGSIVDLSTMTAQQLADAVPFAVSGGVTYIKKAHVKDLDTNNLKVKGIAADRLSVADLASVSPNMGDITAGSLNIGSGKFVLTSAGAMTVKDAVIKSSNYDGINGFQLNAAAAGTEADPNIYGAYIKGSKINAPTISGGAITGTAISGGAINGVTITGANVTASVLQDSTYNLGAGIVKYTLALVNSPANLGVDNWQTVSLGTFASGGVLGITAMYGVPGGAAPNNYIRLKDLSSHHGYWHAKQYHNGELKVYLYENDIYSRKMSPNGLTSMYIYFYVVLNSSTTNGMALP